MNKEQYVDFRRQFSFEKVSFGYRTVTLLQGSELESAQLGYSIGVSGEPLTGPGEGDWKSSWVVIAEEDLLGEPLFADLDGKDMPVYTAAHGQGAWNPEMIANTFIGFVGALEEIRSIATGRENPVQLDRNPLSDTEKQEVLRRIKETVGVDSVEFWESWLDT